MNIFAVLLCQNAHQIQNEILDCRPIYKIHKQTLIEEIQNANFVSIQADKRTDISCMTQLVILLRCVKRDSPVENFILLKLKIAWQKVWRQF
jgi:hypothetical protein